MSESYQVQLWKVDKAQHKDVKTYLSGLYTSKYGDEFMLHYICPLCGEQIIKTKKLNMLAGEITIDYQHEVLGHMAQGLRLLLVDHYRNDCSINRQRKEKMAEILIDKMQDGVYE